jgi:diadenosine tetraphosphatase ApaH/serine/threonine PP2A family protein phosphatase
MRVAVISDIHANLQALEAVLVAVDAIDADELWCLGDLVGYGADPNDCVQLVRENASVCLAGNHDLAVTGELRLDDFSRGAALAARWTLDVIGDSELEWLSSLSSKATAEDVGLFHGSPRDPVWEYVISTLLADLCFDTMRTRIGLIGHSHVALAFHRTETELATGDARRDRDSVDAGSDRWLLNPGSVGQPRDGDPRAAWLLLDTESSEVIWQRTEYDVAGAAAAIRAARLPDSLADRLQYGQ